MMMKLPPAAIGEPKQAAGAKLQFQRNIVALKLPLFPANGVEHLATLMNRVVQKHDADSRPAVKNALIAFANVGPAAPDASERVGHRDLVRISPVAPHQIQISSVKRPVEFAERPERLSGIHQIFVSCERHHASATHACAIHRFHAIAPMACWRLTLLACTCSCASSIPSRRILAIKVVRAIPKRAAAPCRPPTTHLVSSRACST